MTKITTKVQTQQVSIHQDDGFRPHNLVRKKEWRDWVKHKDQLSNVRDAIAYAIRTRDAMTPARWGVIVVIRRVSDGKSTQSYTKIFEAKVMEGIESGRDGLPFTEYYGVAGDYWKLQLGGRK